MMKWDEQVRNFIRAANANGVRMIMVGGGAVNWHGYKRHSADVDFWLDMNQDNLDKLLVTLNEIGFELAMFPEIVNQGLQNISLKFSPIDLDVELITRFSINKPFDDAYSSAVRVQPDERDEHVYWFVLAFDDLIVSKEKAGRPKDLLDIIELKRITNR
jgi:hypothetical protein